MAGRLVRETPYHQADVLPAEPEAVGQGDVDAAFGVSVGHAEGVGGGPVADQLAVDGSATAPGVLEFLKDDHPRPLAQNKPVPVAIERARGGGRVLVVCR